MRQHRVASFFGSDGTGEEILRRTATVKKPCVGPPTMSESTNLLSEDPSILSTVAGGMCNFPVVHRVYLSDPGVKQVDPTRTNTPHVIDPA